jgi:nitrous oxidase accessory protein NosD
MGVRAHTDEDGQHTSLTPPPTIVAGLRAINFRQNLLNDDAAAALGAAQCKATLEDLELRDNQLTQARCCCFFTRSNRGGFCIGVGMCVVFSTQRI